MQRARATERENFGGSNLNMLDGGREEIQINAIIP